MSLFRRREPLHERLAREGGLVARAPLDPRPAWQETGIHGIQRPREWDLTLTAEAPDIDGDGVRFVALPDGTLLVEEGPDDSLEPLASAVEQQLSRPYRARGVRQGESLWAVQARRIEVVELPGSPDGDTIDLTHTADGTTARERSTRCTRNVSMEICGRCAPRRSEHGTLSPAQRRNAQRAAAA